MFKLNNMLSNYLSNLGFLDKRCVCCAEPTKIHKFNFKGFKYNLALCEQCRSLLPSFHSFFEYSINERELLSSERNIKLEQYDPKKNCVSCFLPFYKDEHARFVAGSEFKCLYCLSKAPTWRDIYCYGEYSNTLRELLLATKFSENLNALRLVSLLLVESIFVKHYLKYGCQPFDWDFIAAVPLHPKRLRTRGFNQSLEIAKLVGCVLKIPVELHALERVVFTKPQAGLTQKQRRLNLIGSIQAGNLSLKKFNKKFQGLNVLLIDDIFTTGTTLEQSTNALLEAGAKTVDIAVVAKTPLLSFKS